jgi:hypothetical protein
MDEMDATHRDYILNTVSAAGYSTTSAAMASNNFDWLKSVPFYEINTTLLNDWEDDGSDGDDLSVTNEDIVTIVDPDNDYYGTYSRGKVLAGSASSAETVLAVSELSNTGLTGSTPIDPDDESQTLNGELPITLDATSNILSFTGDFNCRNTNNSGNKCDDGDYTGITVTMTRLNGTFPEGSCDTVEAPNGNESVDFTCTVTVNAGDTWSGTISFNHSPGGFVFTEANGAGPSDSANVIWSATDSQWNITGSPGSNGMDTKLDQ